VDIPDTPVARALLVGPRVSSLRPRFEERRFAVAATARGLEGIAHLDVSRFDVVLLELALGDLGATEFLAAARPGHPQTLFLLLDDPASAAAIVGAFPAGLDGFIPLGGGDECVFTELARHLARLAPPPRPTDFAEPAVTSTGATYVSDVGHGVLTREAVAALRAVNEIVDAPPPKPALDAENARRQLLAVTRVLSGVLDGPLDEATARTLLLRLERGTVAEQQCQALQAELDTLQAAARQTSRDDLAPPRHGVPGAGQPVSALVVLEGSLALEKERTLALEAKLAEANDALAVAAVDKAVVVERFKTAQERVEVLEQEVATAERRATAAAREQAQLRDELDAVRRELTTARQERAEVDARHQAAVADARTAHDGELQRLRAAAAAVREDLDRRQQRLEAEQAAQLAQARGEATEAARAAARVEHEAALARVAEEHRAVLAAQHARDEGIRDQQLATLAARLASEHEQETRAAVAAALAVAQREHELARQRDVAAALVHARRTHEDAQRKAIDEVVERLRVEASQRQAASEQAHARALGAVERERTWLASELRGAVERTTDLELQLEEARMRVEFLTGEASKARAEGEERVRRAEAEFKRERLRLIDEKQAAASGSQEAVIKLQAHLDDATALRQRLAVVQAEFAGLQAALGDARERDARAEDELRRCQAENASLRERCEGQQREHDRALASLDAARARERVLEEQLASSNVELRRAGDAYDVERRARATAETALHRREQSDVEARVLLEREWGERLAAANAAAEERLRTELRAAAAERDAERTRTDAENVRLLARLAELEEQVASVERAEAGLRAAASERDKRADELVDLRAGLVGAHAGTDPASATAPVTEDTGGRPSVQPVPAAAATTLTLLEALEPLRLGLDAALEYLDSSDDGDAKFAHHLRTLRLLTATLARLRIESAAARAE
jgi:hypothetical protein